VIVYAVIQKHGYDGLALATLVAAILLILMGLVRFGVLLKFIPYPVTTGFTTGIAVVIVSSQIKDFFGLEADHIPPEFLAKCDLYCQIAHTWNLSAVLIATSTLIAVFALRSFRPLWPNALIAIGAATLISHFFNLPVETIQSKFGELPRTLPTPSLPDFSYDLLKRVFPDAITIAMLGAIESLLSAVVADGMCGTKHRSNVELVAQGIGNFGSILFGGIPATGAIARTAANVKLGGRTPVAGMTHALTLFLLMIFIAPLAGQIPLPSLAGILIFVAWNMSELPHFIEIARGEKGEAAILLITFLLTVLIDLNVAVQVGVVLAAFLFLKKMTDQTTVKISQDLMKENDDESAIDTCDLIDRNTIPPAVAVFEVQGPFFYPIADLLDQALARLDTKPEIFILRLHKTPFIDSTALRAIKQFRSKCVKESIQFFISDVNEKIYHLITKSKIVETIGKEHIFPDFESALRSAKKSLKKLKINN